MLRSPNTLSDPSDIGSVSSYSGSTTSTRPSTSDRTQGTQRSEEAKNNGHAVKPAVVAPSVRPMSNGTNSRSPRAEAIQIKPAVKPALILASTSSVFSTGTSPSQREAAAKINGPAVKAQTTSPVKEEVATESGSDKAIVPSSTTNSSSSTDQVQESKREEAKDNEDDEGWQLVASRRRRAQGSDRRSNPDQIQTYCNDNNGLNLEKEESQGAAVVVVENGITDGGHVSMNGSKDSTGVDGDSSTKSSDGRRRQNKNGSLRRKQLKKKKAAEAEKKEGDNEKVDTSGAVQKQYTRVYTLKEYESLKKKKDNVNKH